MRAGKLTIYPSQLISHYFHIKTLYIKTIIQPMTISTMDLPNSEFKTKDYQKTSISKLSSAQINGTSDCYFFRRRARLTTNK